MRTRNLLMLAMENFAVKTKHEIVVLVPFHLSFILLLVSSFKYIGIGLNRPWQIYPEKLGKDFTIFFLLFVQKGQKFQYVPEILSHIVLQTFIQMYVYMLNVLDLCKFILYVEIYSFCFCFLQLFKIEWNYLCTLDKYCEELFHKYQNEKISNNRKYIFQWLNLFICFIYFGENKVFLLVKFVNILVLLFIISTLLENYFSNY